MPEIFDGQNLPESLINAGFTITDDGILEVDTLINWTISNNANRIDGVDQIVIKNLIVGKGRAGTQVRP